MSPVKANVIGASGRVVVVDVVIGIDVGEVVVVDVGAIVVDVVSASSTEVGLALVVTFGLFVGDEIVP